MIDIHTHILPDLDDGPGTLEDALAVARCAFENGTRVLVATPHVLNRLNSALNSQIINTFREFEAVLARHCPDLRICLGSEIYFQPNLADLVQFTAATLNGTRRYMLVEFPMGDIPRGFERELLALQQAGIVPIIAHPERNMLALNKPAVIRKMVDSGALIQINSGSITGSFGRPIRKLAQNLLRQGLVHLLASDAHGLTHRGPDLQAALEAAALIIGAAEARRLVGANPQIVLDGSPWPGREFVDSLQGEEHD